MAFIFANNAMSVRYTLTVTTSLKSNDQLYTIPPTWFPHPLLWHTYPDAVNFIPFFTEYKLNKCVCETVIIYDKNIHVFPLLSNYSRPGTIASKASLPWTWP